MNNFGIIFLFIILHFEKTRAQLGFFFEVTLFFFELKWITLVFNNHQPFKKQIKCLNT
jgi:hypothetical protein